MSLSSCCLSIGSVLFFCFKQKMAYELRISDWSSDVCSSDLKNLRQRRIAGRQRPRRDGDNDRRRRRRRGRRGRLRRTGGDARQQACYDDLTRQIHDPLPNRVTMRSEEHTSELQSLMRISYAVFCLKKKTKNKYKHEQHM